LYNLGVSAAQLDKNPESEGTGAQNFAYNKNNYNLLDEN